MVDADAVREFYAAREMFEGLVARECCGRLMPEQAAELRELAEQVYQVAMADRQQEKAALDQRFHSRIVEISGNRLLISMGHRYRVLGKVMGAKCDPSETRSRHLAIVDAIESGDPDLAERVAREDTRSGRRIIEEKLAKGSTDVYWVCELSHL
jgi:DNA-binding GntR family transcriptional regulator